jgi:cysteine desulfurase
MARSIYFDYCATTPIHPKVRQEMLTALEGGFGNPSSTHWAGKSALNLINTARHQVAEGIHCRPEEVVFTSGATEADNLALLGVMRGRKPGAHLITSAIEHHAILHTGQQLEREGYEVTYLAVNGQGLVDPEAVQRAIRPETALISIMMVNNEIGTIQPVAEIGKLAREAGVLMHTDAVQALGLLAVDVDALHVDLLSLSAHKIYGPKGVGALYARSNTRLKPLLFGGPQEQGHRAGTENVPGITGLGAAVRLVGQEKAEAWERISGLRRQLIAGLQACIPGLQVNGSREAVSPHVISATFPGADSEAMLLRLNNAGAAVSTGSACNSKSIEPSHVLSAMGLPREQAEATLRISLGLPSTPEEIDWLLEILPDIYFRSRAE